MAKRRTKSGEPTRAIGYIRVSTDKQADHGLSLEVQREKLAQYAALYGLELVEVIEDAGESAKSLDRPGLRRALDLLAKGTAGALLVTSLDRLTRSVRDLGDLLDGHFRHAALLSVGERIDTSTASGRMVLNVITSISQWERERIGERTAAAMAHKAARGEFTGGEAPYGFKLARDAVTLTPVKREQAVIARARELVDSGLSYRAAARQLADEGARTRANTAPVHVQVARWTRAPARGETSRTTTPAAAKG